MEDEIKNFVKIWIKAISCLCYCYYVSSRIPKGIFRLLSLLPIIFVFLLLPLTLHSYYLCGSITLVLVWLCSFKLLLFAFDQGPLSPLPPNILHFILISSLPIKIKPKNLPNNYSEKRFTNLILFLKLLLLVAVVHVYDYRDNLHPSFILFLYGSHMLLDLELMTALYAAPARVFGFQIEPQFNEPLFSTSLQDFWGRRWNLMYSNILRLTVYDPMRQVSMHVLDQHYSPIPARLATFAVSGLIHELIYYYLARVPPTWEVTWFFVLHGLCTTVEVEVKKVVDRRGWRLHRMVSGPLTVLFLAITAGWLLLPQLIRNGVSRKALKESSMMMDFVKSKLLLQ